MQTFISLSRNKTDGRDFLMEEIIQKIADRELRAQFERVASFHGYLAGCTIGNKGLKIKDYGKMAATVSLRGPPGGLVKAVRIVLDPAKTAKYHRLHAWFMKTCKVPHPEDRLKYPMKRVGDSFGRISWDEVLDLVAQGLSRNIRKHGPKSLGFLASSRCNNEENSPAE